MQLIITLNVVWMLVAIPGLLCVGFLGGGILLKKQEKLSKASRNQLINEIKNCRLELQSLRKELAALKGSETIVRSLW